MQLKYNRQPKIGNTIFKFLIKLFFAIVLLVVVIFLIEKIKFPSPEKKFKIDVTNEIKKL
jgi:flagellar biogenesis protein FliO|tara:strand:- start:197 stop:376 length:180 start_codon:yes stop_codon:yes gene_type:complete